MPGAVCWLPQDKSVKGTLLFDRVGNTSSVWQYSVYLCRGAWILNYSRHIAFLQEPHMYYPALPFPKHLWLLPQLLTLEQSKEWKCICMTQGDAAAFLHLALACVSWALKAEEIAKLCRVSDSSCSCQEKGRTSGLFQKWLELTAVCCCAMGKRPWHWEQAGCLLPGIHINYQKGLW